MPEAVGRIRVRNGLIYNLILHMVEHIQHSYCQVVAMAKRRNRAVYAAPHTIGTLGLNCPGRHFNSFSSNHSISCAGWVWVCVCVS
jgi:hypothetical protein